MGSFESFFWSIKTECTLCSQSLWIFPDNTLAAWGCPEDALHRTKERPEEVLKNRSSTGPNPVYLSGLRSSSGCPENSTLGWVAYFLRTKHKKPRHSLCFTKAALILSWSMKSTRQLKNVSCLNMHVFKSCAREFLVTVSSSTEMETVMNRKRVYFPEWNPTVFICWYSFSLPLAFTALPPMGLKSHHLETFWSSNKAAYLEAQVNSEYQ